MSTQSYDMCLWIQALVRILQVALNERQCNRKGSVVQEVKSNQCYHWSQKCSNCSYFSVVLLIH